MIFYLLDFFINNTNYFLSTTILINLEKYSKNDLLFLLFLDIFINKIPFIFLSILVLRQINKLIDKILVQSIFRENLIFLLNYGIFMIFIFCFRINYFSLQNIGNYIISNFFPNYLLFWFLKEKNM